MSSLRTAVYLAALAGAGAWSYYVIQRWMDAAGSGESPSGKAEGEAEACGMSEAIAPTTAPMASPCNGGAGQGRPGIPAPAPGSPASGPGPSAAEMQAKYDAIERSLHAKGGINVEAVRGIRKYFEGLSSADGPQTWGSPWPKDYTQLSHPEGPLLFPSVRLLVVPLEDAPRLVSMAAAATREVVAQLPPGDMFLNARGDYHITLFHVSDLFDPVTDPLAAGGGVEPGTPPFQRQRSSDAVLSKELELLTALAADTPAPVLEVDRIALADSGTLLLLLTERSSRSGGGGIGSLRQAGRRLFPGKPAREPNIIHVTLMRTLNPTQLSDAQLEAVGQACRKWSAKMRGMTFSPANLWFVHERQYSTVVGRRHILPLRAAT
eukprot:jgi/Tetstr1/466923/TSEL_011377.t1